MSDSIVPEILSLMSIDYTALSLFLFSWLQGKNKNVVLIHGSSNYCLFCSRVNNVTYLVIKHHSMSFGQKLTNTYQVLW